jgi:tetratricopeptide (TPR) repeat protein
MTFLKKNLVTVLAFLVLLLLFLPFLSTKIAEISFSSYQNREFALLLNYRSSELALTLGNYYFNGGEYDLDKAERAYKRAVKIKPEILWGHYQLARIQFVRGNITAALKEINKELEHNPENLRSLYVRGLIYGFAGDLQNAEKDFERFVSWAPKEWAGYNDLIWILSQKGDYRKAKEVALLAFEEVSGAEKNPWLWNSLGVAELNLGEYSDAGISFERAKLLLEDFSSEEFARAYPGNNPNEAKSGLGAFRSAVKANLIKAGSVDNLP